MFRNGGGGVNLRKALVTFVLLFGMEVKGQIWPFLYLEAILLKNCSVTSFSIFA